MTSNSTPDFVVVGAGLSGTLMAAYLGKAGYTVAMYEKRPDPRRGGAPAGRSINLAISVRGIHALEEIGIARDVLSHAVPMKGRMMHDPYGRLTFQPYGTRPEHAINSVSRGGLNITLLDAAQRYDGVQLHFDSICTAADLEAGTVEITNGQNGHRRTVAGRVVIGSDGAFSAVRRQMVARERCDYQQHYLTHGYKELTIPPADGGGFRMDNHALHIWPRGGFMMIALPNEDGSYTCTLFWPFDGPNSFAEVQTPDQIRRFFRTQFPDAVPHMPGLVEDYLANPVGSMVTVRCSPWYHEGRFVLLGDAAHAVVPFYGQGMNASFEDCTVLNECLRKHAPRWQEAFQDYHQRRKRHCDALADLAVGNFLEMRDYVGGHGFLFKKKLERFGARLLPGWFVPLYTMISFTRIPYADAVDRARRQKRTAFVAMVLFLLVASITTIAILA